MMPASSHLISKNIQKLNQIHIGKLKTHNLKYVKD